MSDKYFFCTALGIRDQSLPNSSPRAFDISIIVRANSPKQARDRLDDFITFLGIYTTPFSIINDLAGIEVASRFRFEIFPDIDWLGCPKWVSNLLT